MKPAGSPIANWSLRRRLLLLFSTAAVAVVLGVGLTTYAVVHLNATVREQVDTIDPAQVAAQDLFNAIVDQETGERGYVISRNTAFLAPYRTGLAQENTATARLRDLLRGDAALRRSLDGVLAATTTWQTDFAVPTILAAEAGRHSGVSPEAAAVGKRRFDAVRASFAGFQQALAARHHNVDAQLSRADVTLAVLLGIALAALLAALMLVWVGIRRWVSRPIARLAAETRVVSGGDLAHHIAVAGPPDLRSLAADVDGMRARIVRDFARLETVNAELDRQADALRRSNADLEQFAYVASHDLQEPLRKVASFSELILRRYDDRLDDRGREYLRFVADGARRMQQLINDVLELSRVGRASSELLPVSCTAAAETAVSNLAAQVQEAAALVEVEALPVVMGNRALLVALFQNLISNSLKFRGDAVPRIVLEAAAADGRWIFAVSDNGIGVDPRHGERIFGMFQRLHERERYGGTGIGLALCKRIVEHHGGTIWLDTTVRSGTTIRWSLPRIESDGVGNGAVEMAST